MSINFDAGLLLENSNRTIPWLIAADDLPLFEPSSVGTNAIVWDGNTCLQGITCKSIAADFEREAIQGTVFLKVLRFWINRMDAQNFENVRLEYQETISHLLEVFGPSTTSGQYDDKYPFSEWAVGRYLVNCNIHERFVEWFNLSISPIC